VFAPGEKYEYNKDLKRAFDKSLGQSLEMEILKTIPEHVFWDIKTPQSKQGLIRMNRYNPFRGREFTNFFEMRASEEALTRQEVKNNINDSTSTYRRY